MKNILKNIYNDIMHIKTFIIIFIIAFISLNLLFHKICLISIITGFPCPGCGMTRAFVNLLTFHFKDAFYWSPSIFLWVPLLIYGILNRYIFKCSNKIFTILLSVKFHLLFTFHNKKNSYLILNILYHLVVHLSNLWTK